jgi:glycosyltransferase involved in cell wall biosynthesis
MKIAFVTLPGMPVGGVPTCLYRTAKGMIKIGHDVNIVAITKKSLKSFEGYIAAGMYPQTGLHIGNDVRAAVKCLNSYDFIVYDQACGYQDLAFRKENPDSLPWYYDIIQAVKTPAVAWFHLHHTYGKHSPYINVWEDVCKAFVTNRLSVAEDYTEKRGAKDVFIVPFPIELLDDGKKYFDAKLRIIASTHRLDPIKRVDILVNVMKSLPDWRAKIYSGENVWYHRDEILKKADEGIGNVSLHLEHKFLDYDSIYRNAALVYHATKFEPMDYGSTESAVLEGVVRGAVPLISNEWILPDGFDEESAFKFSIYKKESDLVDVVGKVYPGSKEYCAKQAAAYNILEKRYKDTRVAKLLEKVLKSV